MIERLHRRYSGTKDLWLVEGAGHVQSYGKSPAEYERRVLALYDRYVANLQTSWMH